MNSTYYTSLSGMMAASYGLQNTSNNVANMQSPGFKRNDVFYSSLGGGNGEDSLGSGVYVGGNSINFSQGKYKETENPADLAVVGQGFFVVRLKSGELLYTRDGEFSFNNEGLLIDRHSGGAVQGYNHAGNLVPIHEKGPETSAGKVTSELFAQGKFIRFLNPTDPVPGQTDPTTKSYKNVSFTVNNVFDAHGKAQTLSFEFQCTPGDEKGLSWELITITCADPEVNVNLPGFQKIVFASFQSAPEADSSSIHFSLNDRQDIILTFGTIYSGNDHSVEIDDSAANPTGTNISVIQNDGYGIGKQIGFSFDENGQIAYNYDNGQTELGLHVGLARFDDIEHTLIQTKDNLFKAKSNAAVHIGRANTEGFGSIKSKNLETSNVDSATEFANIVILQRMFQACSQIMDIDKQLLEGLEAKS
ncbi:MAG: flagellar hook-basal body complex protein [Legionellales bacterium]